MLVSTDDYLPGLPIDVLGALPAPLTVRVLRLPDGRTVPVLSRPDEYAGYVARSVAGPDQVVSDLLVFTRDRLEPDRTYRFLDDATVFDGRLKLLRATVRAVDSSSDGVW